MSPVKVKVVIVGDGLVGKTCFLRTWVSKSFPTGFVPQTIFDNYSNDITVNGTNLEVALWDTGEYICTRYSAVVD